MNHDISSAFTAAQLQRFLSRFLSNSHYGQRTHPDGRELAQVGGELEAGKIEAGIQLEMEYPRGGYFIAAETQKRIGTRSNLLTITTKLQNPNEQLWQCH